MNEAELYRVINKHHSQKTGGYVMSLADRWMREGEERGKVVLMQELIERNLLKEDIDLTSFSKELGVSIEELTVEGVDE